MTDDNFTWVRGLEFDEIITLNPFLSANSTVSRSINSTIATFSTGSSVRSVATMEFCKTWPLLFPPISDSLKFIILKITSERVNTIFQFSIYLNGAFIALESSKT